MVRYLVVHFAPTRSTPGGSADIYIYIYIYIVGIRFVLFLGCLECSLNGFVVMCVRVVALFSSAIDSLLFFGLSRRIEYCGALWEKW